MEASGYFKYPRTVSIDFTKLDREALIKIIKSYGAVPSHATTNLDLACVAARYFEAHTSLENDIVDSFANRFCHMDSDAKRSRKLEGRVKEVEILRIGEQAAARVSKTDSGSWILVNILYFDATTDRYDVQDEDDPTRMLKLDMADVRKLEDVSARLRRGDHVMAVFPETTSFYPGIVAKNPKPGNGGGISNEVIVKFDDDEDDQGKPVARKVPARFVLPNENSLDDDSDD